MRKPAHKIVFLIAVIGCILSFSSCVIVHPGGWHRGWYWHEHAWHEHRDW